MKTIGKFIQENITYIVKVKKTESGSNYNLFCHVFREGEPTALTGMTFKDTETKQQIMKWASLSIVRYKTEPLTFDNKPKTAEEEYPELNELAKQIVSFITLRINNALSSSMSGATIQTKCPYPAQCTLEMVIKKLQKVV